MQKSLITFFFALAAVMLHAQSITDGRQMFYDRLTQTYLCSVPETMFDDGSVNSFTCDTAKIDFTFLPIVCLHGEFGYEYTNSTIEVVMPDATSQGEMSAKTKWRGGTTNAEGKNKRNYSIKFIDAAGEKMDRKFFGLRNDNHWILDAAQVDLSRVRNRVATDLWNDFATKPYYFDREPKALTGTRGQFVELFLNDEYRGIYCLTENVDRKQMKLKKFEQDIDGTTTIHGQLWKCTGYENTNFGWISPYDNTLETWGDVETKYPELEDVFPTDYSVFYNAQRFIRDCEWEEFSDSMSIVFDLPVLDDYYLFVLVLNAVDNCNGKNIFWGCYDAQEDCKITPAVWDLDCTVGQFYEPDNAHHECTSPEYSIETFSRGSNLFAQYFGFNDTESFARMAKRYQELRQTYFSEESLKARYINYMDMLTRSGAYERETKRWSGDTDIAGAVLDFNQEREYITSWIPRRLAHVDAFMQPFTDGIKDINTNIDSHNNIRNKAYNLQGQCISQGTTYKGIVIINGRKYMK